MFKARNVYWVAFRVIPFLVLLCLLAFPASADRIKPSGRVSSQLNVRELPNTDSSKVGRLLPGESAELMEDVPYWYKVRLDDGTVGYVSKAWSVKITTETTPLVIGSWNIKWFGYYPQDLHTYGKMADIIQRFDVCAIQELRGSNYQDRMDNIIQELSNRNLSYSYIYSDETGYKDNPDENHPTAAKKDYLERYAFMWNTNRVRLVDTDPKYTFVSTPRINNPVFRQVPIYTDFEVTQGNGFDFRILTIHTVFNKKLHEVRRAEIQYLNDWLIDQVQSNDNEEKNIVVIGDFNANPKGQTHHFDAIVTGTDKYRVLFDEPLTEGESSLRTTIQQSDNPGPDYFKKPVYDHALVSHETSYALPNKPMTRSAGDLGIIEFDQDDHWASYEDWDDVIRAMSDHRPIWFKLDYMAADLDQD